MFASGSLRRVRTADTHQVTVTLRFGSYLWGGEVCRYLFLGAHSYTGLRQVLFWFMEGWRVFHSTVRVI